MCVELVIAVALRNRDRLLLIWPYVHDFLAAILAPAQVRRVGCRAHERPMKGYQSREDCLCSASACIWLAWLVACNTSGVLWLPAEVSPSS